METAKRKAEYPINPLFINRWSQRAMTGEIVSTEDLHSLFEAARWAPSSYNNQHWRFLYTQKGSKDWDLFFNLLMDMNKAWANNAGALVAILSKKTLDLNGKPAPTHSFDTGAAWQNFCLQATDMGLTVRGIGGFHHEAAVKDLAVSDEYHIEAMAAVGHPGSVDQLPEELREREVPSQRKPVSELAFEGIFPDSLR